MSTARTTPAQKPRGRTRRSTFPLVSVGIFFLSQWFIKTLSYLRGGVCWMQNGGGRLYRRAAGFGKPGLQKGEGAEFAEWRLGGWGLHRREIPPLPRPARAVFNKEGARKKKPGYSGRDDR